MAGRPARACTLAVLLALTACGSQRTRLSYQPERSTYPAPGPEYDPWGPYIDEASHRFSVPSSWIRAVMRQESGGNEYLDGQPITSGAGAMGLMQLMPDTYADLQSQYGLGGDPYDPHDNILAGTAYIRQMYDKYGSPGFLAAYNAGPARVDDYLAGQGDLPAETVNYVAAITPHLADEAPPVEVAEAAPPPSRPAVSDAACWHDPDAAYDPTAPCESPPVVEALPTEPTEPAVRTTVYAPAPTAIGSSQAPPPPSGMAPVRPVEQPPILRARYVAPVRPTEDTWAIQVGAFARSEEASLATSVAQRAVPATLAASRPQVTTVSGLGGHLLYRARLAGLDHMAASLACGALRGQAMPCLLVPPGG